MMRFYNQAHRFYAGVDLHARTLAVCILDQAGAVVFEANLAADPQAFLRAVAPFRAGLVVACECMFAWYWLADLCAAEGIPFVLGHALYMKAIHGGKSKNDKLDAHKIAVLLRGGMIPQAYVYPKGMRETRDLLRRRMFLVHKRAEAVAHIQMTNSQYNLPAFGKKLVYARNRADLAVAERFTDPSVRKSIEVDLALIDHLDASISELELYLTRTEAPEIDLDSSRRCANMLTSPYLASTYGTDSHEAAVPLVPPVACHRHRQNTGSLRSIPQIGERSPSREAAQTNLGHA
jgi:hypothetical protein